MSLLLILVLLSLFVYFIPTLVAESRGHNQRGAIFILNLLFGWSFIGWVLALIWAFTNQPILGDSPLVQGTMRLGAEIEETTGKIVDEFKSGL
jgi:hypothetical protein